MQSSEEVELKRLCEQLDDTLDVFFRTLKELLNTRQELDQKIKDGYLFMARARYSMGAKSVTSLQYNPDDLQKAFSLAKVLPNSDGYTSFQPDISSLKARTCSSGRLRNSQNLGFLSKFDSESVELDQIGHSLSKSDQEQISDLQLGLRRRNLPKEVTNADTVPSDSSADDASVEELVAGINHINCEEEEPARSDTSDSLNIPVDCKEYGKDPLLWFGVLIPQSLRQSQTSFQDAVKLCCRVATLQQHLVQYKALYKELMARKSHLLKTLCKMSASVVNTNVKHEEILTESSVNELSEGGNSIEAAL